MTSSVFLIWLLYIKQQIQIRHIAIAVMCLAAMYVTYGQVRTVGISEITEKYKSVVRDKEIADWITDFDSMMFTVYYTKDAIDNNKTRLWLGRSYVYPMSSLIPNVWGTVRGSDIKTSGALWLSTEYFPERYYHHGQGTAYSTVAEAFLNFGRIGVVFIFIIFGILVRFAEKAVESDSIDWFWVSGGVFLNAFLYTIRLQFSTAYKPFVWGVILIYVCLSVNNYYRRRVLFGM